MMQNYVSCPLNSTKESLTALGWHILYTSCPLVFNGSAQFSVKLTLCQPILIQKQADKFMDIWTVEE